jgi:cyclohexanecarboxylate-CoA ligase
MLQPTLLSEARRRRHEAAGEWPAPTLTALLEARVAATPDAIYAIDGASGGRWSFRDLKVRADAAAGALRRLGIERGDVVSWQLPNWLEAPALALAVDRVGAISNPIIPMYRAREVGFICRQARSRALVVPGVVGGCDHREIAADVRRAAPDLEYLLTVRAAPGGGMHALEALADTADSPLVPAVGGADDVSMVFYTSGTTAEPKGVLHTPSTLGALVRSHERLFRPVAADRGLLQFPITHIGGMLLYLQSQLATGSSIVVLDGFDPAAAIEAIARYGVTGAGGPPAVLQGMLAAPNLTPEKVRTLRTSGSGAADVSPELMRAIERRLGVVAHRSYGMTECPMFSSGSPEDPPAARHETDGRPLPGCAVRIVDDRGRPLGAEQEGEIEITGPQLCVGYVDPALNEAFTADDFIRTGDLGVVDTAGFLRITGRRKDVILRKGETLSARDIEDLLAEHPAICDAAVIGVPDAARGERVCACVVLRPEHGELSLEDVRAFMEQRGAMRQKCPEQLEVLEVLPRNATGKILKEQLRRRFGRS